MESLHPFEPDGTKKSNRFSLCYCVPFLEVMVGMGFTPEEIKDALLNQKYNEVTATYLLLGLKTEVSHTEVCRYSNGIVSQWLCPTAVVLQYLYHFKISYCCQTSLV